MPSNLLWRGVGWKRVIKLIIIIIIIIRIKSLSLSRPHRSNICWSRLSSVSLFYQRPQSLPEGWRPLLAIYVSQQRRKSLPNNVIIKYRVKSPIFTRILREPTLVAHAKPPSTKNITTQRELWLATLLYKTREETFLPPIALQHRCRARSSLPWRWPSPELSLFFFFIKRQNLLAVSRLVIVAQRPQWGKKAASSINHRPRLSSFVFVVQANNEPPRHPSLWYSCQIKMRKSRRWSNENSWPVQ